MKSIIGILLIYLLYSCSNPEKKHLIKKLNNGIIIDLYVQGEDVGFNDISYTRNITLKKQSNELKLDLGKSQWPGGYLVFHSFKTQNSDSVQLMVFFNYNYSDNVFKVVDSKNLILIEDTAILNQIKKVGELNNDRIYWGDFEREAVRLEK